MKSRRLSALAAVTLVETIVAAGVFMVVSVAAVTGVIALQRNLSNSGDYAMNHAAQLRISDYIARDLRQAVTFEKTGTGAGTIIRMEVPNYYRTNAVTGKPEPRPAKVKANGTVSYEDDTVSPVKATNIVRYFIQTGKMHREFDGAARVIADDVENFEIIPLDSTVDPNALLNFNLSSLNSKVAEVKVQVNFKSRFGTKTVTQTFHNTTLMRNARNDAQTSLY